MAPNLLTRFRPLSDPAAASIYQTIHEHDEEARSSDEDEDPFTDGLHHRDLSVTSPQNQPSKPSRRSASQQVAGNVRKQSSGKLFKSRKANLKNAQDGDIDHDDVEDDVPASLLIEDSARMHNSPQQPPQQPPNRSIAPRTTVPSRWQSPSSIRLHPDEETLPTPATMGPGLGSNTMATATPKEKAMWRWANVENLDNFLADVYDYYILKGYRSIVLRRFLNLATVIFVIGFCLFLTQCINYSSIKGSTKLHDILVYRCTARMGFLPNAILWLATLVCIIRCFQYVVDIRRLKHLHDFYLHLLNIPESEIQSISWQEVVSRLMALRDSNPNIRTAQNPRSKRFIGTQSKQRMDAHDIANRLMRKDNYMIAMVNKDVLDTSLALPFLGSRQFFTRTLEWHLNYCIMDYVFNSQGQVRQLFLKETHRKALSEGLKRRFVFAGTTSLIFAPVLIIYFIVQNFFQHFNEYQKDPAKIGSRQYNVYAQWKFREFNELWHLFDRRLKMSHPFATRYINQFPKDKTVQAARFITFVSGAIVSVLGLATILDQESFLGFEITPGRTTIFYLGVFGSIWAVARGMLPDDNMIYDSSYSMEEVIDFTHYKPSHWDGRLHTVEVKTDFESLYQMQIVVLMEEILSMIFTPFVLWFTLPKCSDRIIDFFREFTVNVDGLGYVCSFAEFNFKKPAQTGTGANAGTRASNPADIAAQARENEYYATKDDKLEQSYYNFINDYARNPKTDIRFSYINRSRGRQFYAPPPFPGPLSPVLHNDGVTNSSEPPPGTRRSGRHEDDRSNTGRTELASPLQSLLLDPHHQPGSNHLPILSPPLRRTKISGGRSRVLPAMGETIMSTALKEEDEDDIQGGGETKLQSVTHSGQAVEDLGSWKYDVELDGESDKEDDPNTIADGGGVLGMIRHFQRAHDDDKRGGTGV